MNWLDRVIGYVSPTSGLKRQAARKMLTRQVPARAGKRFVGSDRDFGTISNNPDDGRSKKYIDRMTILRLVADNPFARKAMNALLNSYVGWGVSGAPAGTKKLVKMWLEWIENCDYDGVQDLYGLQELWATSQFRDGEVFIVNRLVEVEPGQIPLRLQTFDKGMLATHKVGANIRRGIEYDAEGRPIAYHFYRGRPGQAWSSSQTHSFPAEHVIHLFHREWVGQTEGSSVFESVIKRLGDVDEGIEAEVVKANISACMVGFRYRAPNQDGDDPRMGLATGEDIDGSPVEEFRPGMIETLDEGEQITFSTPPKTGGIGDLARLALLAAAAGTNVTYEQLTGDLSNVNFSSYRAGALEFKRTMGRLQYLTLIPICLNRIFAWFMDTG